MYVNDYYVVIYECIYLNTHNIEAIKDTMKKKARMFVQMNTQQIKYK